MHVKCLYMSAASVPASAGEIPNERASKRCAPVRKPPCRKQVRAQRAHIHHVSIGRPASAWVATSWVVTGLGGDQRRLFRALVRDSVSDRLLRERTTSPEASGGSPPGLNYGQRMQTWPAAWVATAWVATSIACACARSRLRVQPPLARTEHLPEGQWRA